MESFRARMLRHRPDTLEVVRKELNIHQPGRIDEAIDILENWIQRQPHFVKKDFSRKFLETRLLSGKGLVERAKDKIDKLFTFRTLMPDYFSTVDVKKKCSSFKDVLDVAHLPQLTPAHHRVVMYKVKSDNFDSTMLHSICRYIILLSEFLLQAEYNTGFQIILDFTDRNIMRVTTKMNPLDLTQMMAIMTEGYGLQVKGIHVISSSKMVDTLISLLKQVFRAKLSERIKVHKTPNTLTEFLPLEIMPADYGGKEKSLRELNDEWLEIITSNEFLEYIEEMNKARTNESCRQANEFNENYLGMPGSFRALSVD